MPGLTATGKLKYNGVEFTGAHHITCESVTEYGESNRTAIANVVTIRVSLVVAEEYGTTDQTLEEMRFRLGQAGKPLVFKQKGFGNDLVLPSGDIDNGPKPEILTWEPIGDAKAAQVTWRVTVKVPPCKYARVLGVSAINWGAQWAINEHGDTTRTLTGYLEVAAKGVGKTSADEFRQFFSPKPVRGYTRTQTWTLLPNKRRLEFSITDSQIPSPNAYPEGITAISGTHRVNWRRGVNGVKFGNSINCTIRPNAGLTGSEAWNVFLTIAIQRMRWAESQGRIPFITGVDVEEDLFGRPQSFSVSYRILSRIKDFIGDTGLWRPIGTDWDRWAVSLSGSTFNMRGNSGLLDVPADDAEVTLCEGQRVISPNNLTRNNYQGRRPTKPLENKKPPPDKSWMYYESGIAPTVERYTSQLSHTQESDDPGANAFEATEKIPGTPLSYSEGASESERTVEDRIQRGGAGSYAVRIMGSAMRAGHTIPRPKITELGGQPCTQTNEVFLESDAGLYFGVPVYRARWAIDYVLPGPPKSIPILPDQSDLA